MGGIFGKSDYALSLPVKALFALYQYKFKILTYSLSFFN